MRVTLQEDGELAPGLAVRVGRQTGSTFGCLCRGEFAVCMIECKRLAVENSILCASRSSSHRSSSHIRSVPSPIPKPH